MQNKKRAKVVNGLDSLAYDKSWTERFTGSVAYLCNSASISADYTHGINLMKNTFGSPIQENFFSTARSIYRGSG